MTASQTRILLAIENKMSLPTVIQGLEEALKRTMLEKRMEDIEHLLCYRVFQNENMLFVLLEKNETSLEREIKDRMDSCGV